MNKSPTSSVSEGRTDFYPAHNLESQLLQRIHAWMFNSALPWWAEHGIDRQFGGFVERFDLAGNDAAAPFKRTRVTCRQVYVFSHAYTLGWNGGKEIARIGVEILLKKFRRPDHSGFARLLTRSGAMLDDTLDLYDNAFALFGIAWAYKALGERSLRDELHRTLDVVETKLRHHSGLGFWHELPARGARQQNPHMHLAEAMLIAHEATGEERFAVIGRELANLLKTHFFDHKTQALTEFFEDDLSRASGVPGLRTEPGHQFEWAWILSKSRVQFGIDVAQEIRGLVSFAERFGVDQATGATFNAVASNGALIDANSRCWPNTERLKAAVALFELDGQDPSQVFQSSCGLLLDRYLNRRPSGTWVDEWDADGRPIADHIPASTLYHVFLACSEILRIAKKNAWMDR